MSNSLSPKSGRLMVIGAALLWGLAGVCVKSIPWGPLSIMGVRCVIGFGMLVMVRKSCRFRITKRNLLGGFFTLSTGILYMWGIKLTTAATAIVLQYMAPIFVLLYTAIFRHRRPSLRDSLIVLTTFFGCVLSFADQMGGGQTLGNLLSLASGVTFAGQIIVFTNPQTDNDDSIMISNLLGALIGLPCLFFDSAVAETTPTVLFWVLVLAIFQYGLANILYARGSKCVGEVECSLLLTLEPLFNPIPVAIFCNERMGNLALIGFFIVLGGITLYSLPTKQKASLE